MNTFPIFSDYAFFIQSNLIFLTLKVNLVWEIYILSLLVLNWSIHYVEVVYYPCSQWLQWELLCPTHSSCVWHNTQSPQLAPTSYLSHIRTMVQCNTSSPARWSKRTSLSKCHLSLAMYTKHIDTKYENRVKWS